jgi:hypothetical protein
MLFFGDMEPAKPKRLGRFTRGPKPPNYQITRNVLDILALAARYDTLATSDFMRLLPHRGYKGLQTTLKLLYRSKLMGRRLEQRENPFAEVQHYIRPEGRELLASKGIEPYQVVAHYTPPPDEKRRLHEHHLLICKVMASIERGAGKGLVTQDELVEFLTHPDPLKLPCSFTHKFATGLVRAWKGHLRADLFFGLPYPDKRRYYLLEAENEGKSFRSHFKASSTLRKVLGYHDIIQVTGVYKEQLGIDNLRVLITASTPARLKGKMRALEMVTAKSNIFLFNLDTIDDLYNTPWLRVGLPPIRLSDNKEVVE